MGKNYNPTSFIGQLTPEHRQWVQGVHKILTGGVDMGIPSATNTTPGGTNAGVYTQFVPGNGSGVLIRVQGTSDNESGVKYRWQPGSAVTVINHGLGRVPIGFIVVDADAAVSVYRTAPSTVNTLSLNTTNNNASTTLYIF